VSPQLLEPIPAADFVSRLHDYRMHPATLRYSLTKREIGSWRKYYQPFRE
jgi:hypothetical protein